MVVVIVHNPLMATTTAHKEQAMTTETYRDLYNRETNLMIEENRVMKERRAADRKAQTYRRRADRAQSTAAYNRVLANAHPHFDAWSALNARCNEISAELRAIRAAMKELDPS